MISSVSVITWNLYIKQAYYMLHMRVYFISNYYFFQCCFVVSSMFWFSTEKQTFTQHFITRADQILPRLDINLNKKSGKNRSGWTPPFSQDWNWCIGFYHTKLISLNFLVDINGHINKHIGAQSACFERTKSGFRSVLHNFYLFVWPRTQLNG